jgi:hypothetical protein
VIKRNIKKKFDIKIIKKSRKNRDVKNKCGKKNGK